VSDAYALPCPLHCGGTLRPGVAHLCPNTPDGKLERVQARLTEALAVLRLVEWAEGDYFQPTCLLCTRGQPGYANLDEVGHAPDCRLARILGGQ
jgi:hypothetical protein